LSHLAACAILPAIVLSGIETAHAPARRHRAQLGPPKALPAQRATLNAAFCLAQSGERDRSIQEYKRVLAHFPGSKIAEVALRLIEPKDRDTQQTVAADRREDAPPVEQ
jgi:hypothetical protein